MINRITELRREYIFNFIASEQTIANANIHHYVEIDIHTYHGTIIIYLKRNLPVRRIVFDLFVSKKSLGLNAHQHFNLNRHS